ncbi:hypothetical protein CONCODRAFT_68866 [Conidiobolus coronatus NRRL 28638]|uniref:Uncharacterized protein n=1 Tax=Conidiobolus coronatus (strain ATCC 28846 / CBS 209.66 / NRRL 28638) TaxID=796925 RepID=A0A137PCE0_CONC2|nr:hypothetical protein CONCODRAFT_68866 [Conidiobolus coronatus NRRL 28638]|eukprot:KXN72674.1 hypothetical protein CONCODRAFT_68866 [Conidiobolus coronatus NRRL 28638]
MKYLFFTLPIIAYNGVWDGGRVTRFWDTANRLWCSSGGSDFSYSASNSKSCCSKMTGNISFTSDGYCTGQEDFVNGPIYAIYENCCLDFRAFTAAHTINGVTPSRIITVKGLDVPVNDTSLPNIDESRPTGPSNIQQIPKPTAVTTVLPKVPENDVKTTVSAPVSSTTSDSTTAKTDSNTTLSSSGTETTPSSSNNDKNSKSAPTGKPLDSVAGSNTSSSIALTPYGYTAILITSIAAALYN